MSSKTVAKRSKRRARQRAPEGRPAYHFHSKYQGFTPEQIEERVRGRVEPRIPSNGSSPSPWKQPRQARLPMAASVTLIEGATTTIREGSLRAAVVDALRDGRGTMTVEELSAALKQDVRPAISKLAQKGWLRRGR